MTFKAYTKKELEVSKRVTELLAGDKKQTYIVQCHTRVSTSKVGLGAEFGHRYYNPGDMVTYNGEPTCKLDMAYIYVVDAGFPWEDSYEWGCFERYFEPVLVTVTRTVKTK